MIRLLRAATNGNAALDGRRRRVNNFSATTALDSAAEYRENNCRNEEKDAEQRRVDPSAREFFLRGTFHNAMG
jgi:hypothetical protein